MTTVTPVQNRLPEVNPLVSVIVPVYNTKDYLKQCLDSLCVQTLKNIEIIIIDDGSTDGSGTVCDQYVDKDSRFRVIHKNNEGLSAARNEGIEIAKSDYILLVDSDDWVEPDICEIPYRIAEENQADVVVFQYSRVRTTGITRKTPFPKEGITSIDIVLTDYWEMTAVVAWNKLYRRDLFDTIKYPVGHLCEDNAVTHRLLHSAERIYLVNSYLYNHRVCRPGGIMSNKTQAFYTDQYTFEFRRLDDLKQWGMCSEKEIEGLAFSYLIALGRESELSECCDIIIKRSSTFLKESSWKVKVLYRIYLASPSLFDIIVKMTGKRVRN